MRLISRHFRLITTRHSAELGHLAFRPELWELEGRVTPADFLWVGNGMGDGAKWSVAANWTPQGEGEGVPGADDVAIFDATVGVGANTNVTMDMGGVGSYHVGKLVIQNGYTSTITLNADLYVDILDMRSDATIKPKAAETPTQGLGITQMTTGIHQATMFGTSYWKAGTLETVWLNVYGEDAHRATLQISPTGSVALKSNVFVWGFSTVEWTSGNVDVLKGKTITNKNNGTFKADGGAGKVLGIAVAQRINGLSITRENCTSTMGNSRMPIP